MASKHIVGYMVAFGYPVLNVVSLMGADPFSKNGLHVDMEAPLLFKSLQEAESAINFSRKLAELNKVLGQKYHHAFFENACDLKIIPVWNGTKGEEQ